MWLLWMESVEKYGVGAVGSVLARVCTGSGQGEGSEPILFYTQ